ncbi:hypothetical protein BCON_0195g00030 [Botryotinia convoluta]|uniref:Uncharacterized protein n=1 Tax=Botryotinia convoluta TaxID=54673 RepID=A0A4Z1HZ25_9HELO|nr:hypothetical protein BCON_0195g00030 [Botryotinia convoluta]
MSNHPSLSNLDFGEIDITPPSLRRQSGSYSEPTGHEFGSIPQLPSSFSDVSSLLDSRSRTSDIAIKSTSSRSQARVHDIRHCLMEYYVDWKWEFFASLIVVACPFIIITTLYPNAGKPLPQWPFQISINTLLSIYGLVFKTCLTFIVVSCIGQLQWFWFSSHRPLYDVLCYDRATRGPWGSIQLLCSKHIRHPLTGLGAIILIAAVAIDPLIQQLVLPYDCEVALLNIEVTLPRTNQFDNVHSALMDPTSGLPIKSAIYAPENWMTWQCITGNCTFSETYGTLAYCSSCEDISDKLIFETTYYDEETHTNITSTTGYCAGTLGSFATTSLFTHGEVIGLTRQLMRPTSESHPPNPLAIAVILDRPDCPGEKVYIIVPRTVDPAKRLDPDSMSPWINRNMTVASNPWRLQGYGAAGNVLSSSAFVGFVVAGIEGESARDTVFIDVVGPRMMMDLYYNGYIEFEDVQEKFSNISDITTAWLRSYGDNTFSDPAVGEVLHYAICLRVQWPWIAFPATLAALSLVCLVAVIIVMDRQQVPIWKSSPLALIMRGSNTEFWCQPTADAMEERSKEITVILIKGSNPQIQVVRKDLGLVDIANRARNISNQTLNDDVLE